MTLNAYYSDPLRIILWLVHAFHVFWSVCHSLYLYGYIWSFIYITYYFSVRRENGPFSRKPVTLIFRVVNENFCDLYKIVYEYFYSRYQNVLKFSGHLRVSIRVSAKWCKVSHVRPPRKLTSPSDVYRRHRRAVSTCLYPKMDLTLRCLKVGHPWSVNNRLDDRNLSG